MFTNVLLYVKVLTLLIRNISAHVDGAKLEEECKIAKICRHDQVPVCGIDSCGEMRTYIDVCDMHEFNCDSKKGIKSESIYDHGQCCTHIYEHAYLMKPKDFVQKPTYECWVTCKRGRSFKKPAYGSDCDINKII